MKNSVSSMATLTRRFFSLFLLLTLLFNAGFTAFGCGPFTTDPIFSFTKHPDYPLADFARGKTGIVPPTFGRASLFAFYRALNNLNLTAREQQDYTEYLTSRITLDSYGASDSEIYQAPDASQPTASDADKWQAARQKVLGSAAKTEISTERRVTNENSAFSFYENCYSDAFSNAAQTLAKRIAENGAGANNEFVKDWLRGQDTVFANCGEGEQIPASAPANAPAWLVKDREYQIGAALFYAAKLPEARQKFELIAADQKSQWNKTAAYLIARTFIRQASFTENESEKNQFLAAAQTQLQKIASAAGQYQDSTRGLISLVKYRLKPAERRQELAQILAKPGENEDLSDNLNDYLGLLDKVEATYFEKGETAEREKVEKSGKEFAYNYKLKLSDVPNNQRQEDLTDWLFSYQTRESFSHSLAKWQETRAPHWYLAALQNADASSAGLTELLAAADQIAVDSPAYATARFQQIRLLLETNQRDAAKQKLNKLFADGINKYPVSTQNKFLSQRLIVADNLDEFLRDAGRRAAAFLSSDDGNEAGTIIKDDAELSKWDKQIMFDEDAVRVFNEKMPLATLRQAALSPNLPAHLKKFLVQAVWLRAYLVGNEVVEREFAPLLSSEVKEFAPALSKHIAATDAVNREATMLLLILRYPVLQPFVLIGYGRLNVDAAGIDSIRGNWWCLAPRDEYSENYNGFPHDKDKPETMLPTFLNSAEIKSAVARERAQLEAGGNSSTFLARRALKFAAQNPAFPQAPEILHLAVRSTRYGCSDDNTGKASKAAFDFLHNRYPNNPWTKKTLYWFN